MVITAGCDMTTGGAAQRRGLTLLVAAVILWGWPQPARADGHFTAGMFELPYLGWLHDGHLALRQSLALGAGRAVEDLARLCGIGRGHIAPFGRLLRRHRALLAPLIADPARDADSLQRARRFFALVFNLAAGADLLPRQMSEPTG